jgi:hypothetical protein
VTDIAPAKPTVLVGVGMPAALHLDAFAREINDAFGHIPYLVGTAAQGKQWRDVDVRLMLPDGEFDALFPDATHPGGRYKIKGNALWALMCTALSGLARQRTGLPIDFQIQRQTEANEKYDGPRIPLGIYVHGGK